MPLDLLASLTILALERRTYLGGFIFSFPKCVSLLSLQVQQPRLGSFFLLIKLLCVFAPGSLSGENNTAKCTNTQSYKSNQDSFNKCVHV